MGDIDGELTQPGSSQSPSAIDACIHELVQKRGLTQPKAPAICAWNGKLTYAELDSRSSSFAIYLGNKGVRPEIYVPLCMEKSSWVPVAMLGVLKAGGAFVLLDPSHPIQRMQDVCQAVEATMIITSRENAAKTSKLGLEVILVDGNTDAWWKDHKVSKTMGTPDNAAYVMFTSGTTGTPKGAIIEHRSFCTSALAHSRAMGMDPGSRVLQFASYAFDASLIEILTTLIVGGCVCIPSEANRKRDLAGASCQLRVNFALFTPSLARVLEVHDFPMLETLVLGGEAVRTDDVQKWAPHVRLFGAYGPTECAALCMVMPYEVGDAGIDASNLGREAGITFWVVDPHDHNRLSPAGTAGELLLDGPSVGRGYINEPARTAEVFIDPPAWYQNMRLDATRKLYKTGDLVRYDAEARSIRYVGRKDNQVKLNGQRIELEEVETQIRRLFDGISNVVVELVTLAEKPNLQMLMALILAGPQSKIEREISAESKRLTQDDNLRDSGEQWILEPNEEFQAQVQLVRSKLQDVIPGYMVPVVMLPLRSMPFMVSGKSDRERLRSLASQMTWKELEAYTHASISFDKKGPSTPTERMIQRLWAGVLQIPSGNIGCDDRFLDVGGDSLTAIKLAGAARREGLTLTVGHIYGHQTLSEMAVVVSMSGPDVTAASIAPFSLLSGPDDRAAMVKLAVRQCRLRGAEEIEDIYPCTPLQAGLISLTAKRPGAYTVALEYELPVYVDIQGFQSAWAEVVEANPILRTRILQARNGLMYQVVVRASLLWEFCPNQVLDKTEPQDWKMGHPLVRLYTSQQASPTEPLRFILVLHHAITDGWAITKILEQVDAAYRGKSIQRRQFNDFIEYISRTNHKNNAFWNKSFRDLNAAVFPAVPSLDYVANPTIKKTCVIETAPAAGIFTISNKMKLAWAILLSLYTESLDVVFGTIVNGRAAALSGIEELTGPTIATIPVRLLLDPDSTLAESLCKVQENFIATIPFEQTGLQNITRAGPEAAAACRFQSLLVVQPEKESLPSMFSKFKDLSELSAFTTYAITLNCQPSYGSVEVEATFDSGVVDEVQLGQMLHQLKHLFEQITPSQRKLRIRDLNAAGSHDWSHKVDYKLLRSLAAENFKHGTGVPTPAKARIKPATDVQRLLHKLLAEVVNIPAVKLSADDNFFRMGGDSIVAMNLVARGREQGLLFTVADIFECPTVISLAEKAQTYAGDPELQIRPFSLIRDGPNLIEIVECALDQCRVERDEIADIYPTTPLQEGLVALATKNPGTYIARFEYLLPRDIDLKRFQKAWSAVCTANSILRTRIIQSAKYGTLQVVIGKPLQWEIYSSLEEERSCSDSRLMSLGTPLMHMALVPSPEKTNHRFVWTIHHALYDGWSMPLLFAQVKIAYEGRRLQPRPFNRFIQYLIDVNGGEEFWTLQLKNLNAATFPSLARSDYSPDPDRSFSHMITNLPDHKKNYTLSSVIQLAWALVLAHYTDSEDVVFGLTVNGRTASLFGITEVTGPTIATIPFRVKLSQEKTVHDSLTDLQEQSTRMIPFLQHGLQNIRKLSPDAAKACEFQSHLGIQPAGILAEETLGWLEKVDQEGFQQEYERFVSYAFTMICHLQDGSSDLRITVNYDSSVLQDTEARRLVHQFQTVVHQLSANPQGAIRDIQVISAEDLTQLAAWNGQVPSATHETLHDLILRQVAGQPDAEAVCAWDGELTYQQLGDYSALLAQHFLTLGISPESRIAICLEKSRWTIVILLAALRAGAACVLLDPAYPRQRIEQLIKKTVPQLLLASETHGNLAQCLGTRVIVSGEAFIRGLAPLSIGLPDISPSQAAFILFTSGSTGKSKAIIMEHVNLSSSICAHSSALSLSSTSRSLHFASYAFDASIYEIFDTLICGGCVCIPSENDRLNDLASAIGRLRVDWAVLTPSTLNLFNPEDVPSLSTLVVAGDTVTRDLVNRWASKLNLINAYGPAEGTCCTVGPIPSIGWRVGTIGYMLGGVGWIANPSDSSKLAAIGSVGELIIEGPVVTRGYLDEPEKTAAAYIDRPTWLQTFRKNFDTGDASGRLYKTGDLVQYNTDGTIRYIGRKDTQVKIRGQRIELGEVEYYVRSCFPAAAEVIAEVAVPKREGSLRLLVACIWLGAANSLAGEENASDEVGKLFALPDKSFRIASQEAEIRLSASIPAHMVPVLYVQLRQVPLTRSEKVDRRRIRDACCILVTDRINDYTAEIKIRKRAPSTSVERTLHGIWARVLNRPPQSFGIDDSFFRMGGDSIDAMQVVAQCAAAGLRSSVAAIFKAKTIARLSLETQQMQGSVVEWKAEELNMSFDLSPIQNMLIETAGDVYHQFHQRLFFRLTHEVPSWEIESAIKRIVTNHSMLRARFTRAATRLPRASAWAQTITDDIEHSYDFKTHHNVVSIEAAEDLTSSRQEALNIHTGPLLVCDLLHVEGRSFLSLIAHHLVIDDVSWQIIITDFEALLATGKLAAAPTLSFQTWSQLSAEYANTNKKELSLDDYPPPLDDYWGVDCQPNNWGDALEESFSLSEHATGSLLGVANDAFKTQPVELLHAAILQSFVELFHDRPTPVIFNAGHGRDQLSPRIDLTRTVGCFTTVWPVDVQVGPEDDLLDIVKRTKDKRRQVAGNGLSSFASQYLHSECAATFQRTFPIEILFTYHPRLLQDSASLLQPLSIRKGELSQKPQNMGRFALLDVSASFSDSRLSFTFNFSRLMRHQSRICQWIQNCKSYLESAASRLTKISASCTLSDFPLLSYSYSELEDFLSHVVLPLKANALDVEDVYPATPIQEGMLLSQAKDSTQYFNKWYWSVHSQDGSLVSPDQLLRAWKQVVQKHPLLRTVFYPSPSNPGAHDQLVLRQVPAEVCVIIATSNEPLKRLQERPSLAIPHLRPPNRLTICGTASSEAACLLEISHTVVDGISAQILLRDLRLAYDDQLEPVPRMAYREYVKIIQQQSINDARTYWEDYLKDVEPCFLMKSATRQLATVLNQQQGTFYFTLTFGQTLREFCSKFELTMATVFQLGWALVLRTYLNDVGACFGYITSGRDAPIPDIDNTVGPFINMLVCRVSPQQGEQILDLLRRNQAEFVQSLTYQHLSLAEKMKSAGRPGMAMFNTIMSVLKGTEAFPGASVLDFNDFGGSNPIEYDLTINIELLENDINVALEYLTTFLSDEQAHNLGDTFQQAILSIISGPQKTVPELDMFGSLSRKRVGDYNAQPLTPIEKCLHELIHARCVAQPFAPAICAWDGDFTYAQLDRMSSILAADLMRRGVGPDVVVPLCFEKSRWTTIALLGILKAGGAFVLLDPSYPLPRLKHICQDTNACFVLTSECKKNLAATLGTEVVVVSDNTMTWTQEDVPILGSTSKPNNALYVVYTSGSTGKPKGAVIEHRSFATSCLAHSAAHQMNPSSRVLQFTSYAWDVNIVEHLSTLLVGGCICVPSEAQRREDFAKVVAAYGANWAFLTPSMSRIMDPSKLKTLQTLVIGGDVVTARELSLWRSHVNLYLIYGPSETSVFCSSTPPVTAEMNDGRNLGHFFGCNAWIVSPEDHNKLLPIGAVGELLIEGPIVGRGYLNNPAQSASVFILPPTWYPSFRRSGSNPFYKTGDLARYTNGGELQFVARKDFQVKLRGQRIELGEVEQHLSYAFLEASDAVAEIITPVGGNSMLVAFVCLARGNAQDKAENTVDSSTQDFLLGANEQFCLAVQAAEQQLSKSIPEFMVPVVFFPIRYVPRTAHKKTDRRRLREAVTSLTSTELEKYSYLGTSKQQPSTEGEILLQRVWARVLNKAVESIGVHDSFFRLGGDSITAMQVASQSSGARMTITVADIFRHKTISQLGLLTKKAVSAVYTPEVLNSPFALSPIQKLFFQLSPQGHNHFSQDFLLRLTRPVSSAQVADAVRQIIQNHSILRARFQNHRGEWMQTIGTDTAGSYHHQEHSTTSMEAADVIFSSSQKRLNITNGPIVSADLINIRDEQYLFLVAHHLVIDLVSWRIILGDLEDCLTTGAISSPPSLSFQVWCRLQEEYATINLDPEQAMLADPMRPVPPGDYWEISRQTNLLKDVVEGGFALDEKITSLLLQEANTAFQTQPVELFLAALCHSFTQTFSDRSAPIIWNEGHGREPWDASIDVARTVGWFTTMWPLYIQVDEPDLLNIIRQMKDKRRSVPSNGWAHFTSSLHPKAQGFSKDEPKEILFNYLGQYQQLERSDSLFQWATRPTTSHIAGDMQRFALIDVSASLLDNCLRFDFCYNKHAAANRPISDWITNCERSLKSIAIDFSSRLPMFTISDFPLMPFNYDTLDVFITQALHQCGISSTEIEDIYPCSPIQRGILLSQAKNNKLYQSFVIWKIRANSISSQVEVDRVVKAWRLVFSRHTILRTVFVKSVLDTTDVDQVVLKTASPEICIISSDTESAMTQRLSEQCQLSLANGRLPYRLSVGQMLTGDVLCALKICHALYDGTTQQILQREFQLAYDGKIPSGSTLPYQEYISYLSKRSETSSKEYWATSLEGVTPCYLQPGIENETHTVKDDPMQSVDINIGAASTMRSFCNQHQLTLPSLFQVAWGLVLRYYVGSDNVCFGYLNSGRDIPIPQIEDAVGPFINVLVCRMDLSSETLLTQMLRENQIAYINSMDHQHCPMIDIIRMADLPNPGSLFNTIISFQVARECSAEEQSSVTVEVVGGEDRSEYDLTVNIFVDAECVKAIMTYSRSKFAEEIVRNISDTFRQAVHEIIHNFEAPISQLQLLGENGRKVLQDWNREVPVQVSSRVDDLIHQRCLELPGSPAVCAWDGDFTYLEVDALSSSLARHVARYDVRPGTFVPLCFEKSRWATIAIMGVIKAGGAFILLDPSYPVQRLQEIYSSVGATVVLASEQQTGMVGTFAESVLTVGDNWTVTALNNLEEEIPRVSMSSSDALYAVFTSGSTGKPKGIIIEHRAFVTSAMGHSVAMHMDETSRVLQFASYAFDVSITEHLTTLLVGGCICVPSDIERYGISVAVARMRVNWALLTPSMAKVLKPADFPSLKVMVITGELISEKELKLWQESLDLYFAYGPAECSVFCSATGKVSSTTSGRNMGHTFGCRPWIVDQSNPQILAPIGAIGELLIEGPVIARSYLENPEKTKESFIQAPTWLEELGCKGSTPIYKTGDLVKYNKDGSLYYISRKDTQVKLRGQRLELGEVEYHLHQSFPNAQGAIAEVVSSPKEDWPPALVAFIALKDKDARNGQSSIFDTPDDSFKRSIISATSKLDSVLPVFMVPTIFIPLHQMPLTKTGKTDRRALKIAAASLTREQIEILTCTESTKRLPTTVAEGEFQRLFADIFGFDTLKIGIDDHFFRLGGDSILAMTLISKARDVGYAIDMADVFNHPKLCDLAGSSRSITAQTDLIIAPFSLIRNSSIQHIMIQSAAEQCKVSISQIEDIYPCTPLQEGLVVLAIKTPGQYVTTFEYELAADIDLHRFQTSWNATVIANPILRTRVLLFESVIFQVVVGEMISWNIYDNQAAYEDEAKALNMGMGESLVHFGVIKTNKDSANGFRFHLTLHHVLYDAHSLGLLWNQVQQAYDNKTLPPRPFNRFIEYISKLGTAENFWRSECASLTAPVFPNLQSSRYIPSPTSSLSHAITCLHHTATEFTMSTLIRMAWAIIISSYTDSEDVVYGMTVDGRNAPIPGIEQLITGPTFATFPMRIHVRPGDSVETALSSIQLKITDMIPFQHSGLQNIRQFGEEAASACNFQFHLGIQAPPAVGKSRMFSSAHTRHEDYGSFANYSLVIICHLPVKGEPNDILIVANYDERALEPLEVTRMVQQFEHILRQMSSVQYKNCSLGALDLLCPEDRKQIEDWNSVLPSSHEACLHDLVLQHSKDRPNAPAISSWDGDMTFRELESACHALTQHLEALGIEPRSLVPLCFERSKWSVIAMIAVIQLGAACVCIDPTHPKGRIYEILHRTNAKFIITSPLNQPRIADADATVVTVPILEEHLMKGKLPRHSISPDDIAFVVFTSGSTGASKAILMEHANLATSIRDYSSEMQINEQTRGLHFASYAFDASIYEIFGTLVNGGCVCIPSEYDRMNNIDLFINEYEVNWAFLTPSFITSIRPESIPGVRTIVLGGEAVTQENVRNWASRVTLVNGYGPAESTVCAVGRIPTTDWKQGTIGRVTGGVGWITMPNDPYRIAPIGAVGELLVEGAVVTRGYLQDSERTAASYINPPWHRSFRSGHGDRRLYRSGDLFQYNPDGTIRYVGRRDTQIKLRGQRIELGEIEANLKQLFPDALDVAAEVVVMRNKAPTIIAFIANALNSTNGDNSEKTIPVGNLFSVPSKEFLTTVNTATIRLRQLLPDYMVPSLFLEVRKIPRTSSDKADRKLMREHAAALSGEQIQELSAFVSSKRKPSTAKEKAVQSLWAEIFKIPLEQIGIDDDFYHMGGDSITAMRLAALARQRSLRLQVSSILGYPVLSDLAFHIEDLSSEDQIAGYRPGSLLGITNLESFGTQILQESPNLLSPNLFKGSNILDILPTTEFQSQFIKERNVTYSRLRLPTRIDPCQVEAACRMILHKHAILRTVFIPYGHETVQVVLRTLDFQMVKLCCDDDLMDFSETICSQDSASPIAFGTPHFQPFLISRSELDHIFILRMTHVQYDGVSYPIIWEDFSSACNGHELQTHSHTFAHYLRFRIAHKTPKTYDFWRLYLSNSQMANNPTMGLQPQSGHQEEFRVEMLKDIPVPSTPKGITLASLVRAAWSIILARNTQQLDVVFGNVIDGRELPLKDIEFLSFPTVIISPFRATILRHWIVKDLLNHVQAQYTRTIPFVSVDPKEIVKHSTTWSPETSFGSILTHQNADFDLKYTINGAATNWDILDFGMHEGIHVVTWCKNGRLYVHISGSSKKIRPDMAEEMIDQLCGTVSDFAENPFGPLKL